LYNENISWAEDDPVMQGVEQAGMSQREAERIFKTAVAISGTRDEIDNVAKDDIYVVNKQERGFEVVEIVIPDKGVESAYKSIYDIAGAIKPIGILKVKHWINPGAPPDDTSDSEEDSASTNTGPESIIEEFWLEGAVLEKCFIGMHFEATVHTLNVGLKYLDTITGIYCSFYDYLPNQKMEGWKEPVPNTRPAPTVDDPSAEQNLMDKDADDVY